MPGYVPSFNTVYEKPVALPPKAKYGKNVFILGLATAGPFNNPTYIASPMEAKSFFGSGKLVDAYEEVYETGCRTIYLTRLESDSSGQVTPESLQKAFGVLEDYETHIILSTDIFFEDQYLSSEGELKSFADLFVEFCSLKKDSGESIAIMAIEPIEEGLEETLRQQYGDPEWRWEFEKIVDSRVTELYQDNLARNGFEEGYYLSVVFGEVVMFENDPNKRRVVSGANVYAGLLSLLSPGQSPVNKKIKSVARLRYSLLGGSKTETVTISAEEKVLLKRRPLEGSLTVKTVAATPVDCLEGDDFVIDYNEGTIVGKNTSGLVSVTYRYDDHDSLSSVGYVTLLNFVKSGPSICSSVTMSKNTIALIQDIRVMQSIVSHIREIGFEFIGETNLSLEYLDDYIKNYLTNLVWTDQIVYGDHMISRTNGGKDLSIEIEIQPREAVKIQTFRIQLPSLAM